MKKIKQSLEITRDEIVRSLQEIDELVKHDLATELSVVKNELSRLFETNKDVKDRTSERFLRHLDELVGKQSKLAEEMERVYSGKLMIEKSKLENDLKAIEQMLKRYE